MDDGSRAIEDVVTRFAGLLRAAGVRSGLSESEMDEVTQELRVRLWKQRGDGNAAPPLSTAYIRQVVRSAIIDRLRRRRAHRDGGSIDAEHPRGAAAQAQLVHDPSTIEAQRQLGDEIEETLGRLPDARRAIVRMWLAGYTRDEIGDAMGWSEAKVRNLLYRGLDDLRALLRARGVGLDR